MKEGIKLFCGDKRTSIVLTVSEYSKNYPKRVRRGRLGPHGWVTSVNVRGRKSKHPRCVRPQRRAACLIITSYIALHKYFTIASSAF